MIPCEEKRRPSLVKLSLQSKIIVGESIIATILVAALFSDYENNIYLRQYLAQALGGFQADIFLESIARFGNFLLTPLRVLTLTLLSLMTLILLLLLLFMFCTFVLSMVRIRRAKPRRAYRPMIRESAFDAK